MIDGARLAGVGVVHNSLTLLAGKLHWYGGDDQNGVQHLSAGGYQGYADCISNVINGAPLMPSGWVNTNEMHHDSPSSLGAVSDNTLKVVRPRSGGGGAFETIGWFTNPIATITYYANGAASLHFGGTLNLISGYSSNDSRCYLVCENWNKKIAPNTLPYVFLGGQYITYYLSPYTTSLQNSIDASFVSTTGERSTKDNIYIHIPRIEAGDSGKTVNIRINGALTDIANFAI